ncbi:MAG: Diguanylate cyclase/phosphodiesterase with PAS/PAC sensor(S) [Microgenomates group bacterium GW2011_GWA1_46_15]|nr:MAG: Diguanylate cyclase/phosphodiesterase with PAS/PAC sensor(S) [Microgenomates group bacterium GW2011_GWB1_45_17]KKU23084.1 MAG: Diguanylate cyclase/phosphodiesterase with PAS/PAC sensor(S) [Microgenomates group bacterium GW2011_GWA1_46_15]KKU23747.1 MAG: Diguanylate cyclase/phosphodiesterase with PAS/PAC sensor(S) [Microgenomates group bacterium GW2011_GWC1_46_15]
MNERGEKAHVDTTKIKAWYLDFITAKKQSQEKAWRDAAEKLENLIKERVSDEHFWFRVWEHLQEIDRNTHKALTEADRDEQIKNALYPLRLALLDLEKEDKAKNAITGLPGRADFLAQLQEVKDHPKGRTFALAYLDVDRLKKTNDEHGHKSGDELLRTVAKRLCESGDQSEMHVGVYHVGGDEMPFVLSTTEDNIDKVIHEIQRILDHTTNGLVEHCKNISVRLSCGVVVMRDVDIDNIERIIDIGDNLQYVAKSTHSNREDPRNKPRNLLVPEDVLEKYRGTRRESPWGVSWIEYKKDTPVDFSTAHIIFQSTKP